MRRKLMMLVILSACGKGSGGGGAAVPVESKEWTEQQVTEGFRLCALNAGDVFDEPETKIPNRPKVCFCLRDRLAEKVAFDEYEKDFVKLLKAEKESSLGECNDEDFEYVWTSDHEDDAKLKCISDNQIIDGAATPQSIAAFCECFVENRRPLYHFKEYEQAFMGAFPGGRGVDLVDVVESCREKAKIKSGHSPKNAGEQHQPDYKTLHSCFREAQLENPYHSSLEGFYLGMPREEVVKEIPKISTLATSNVFETLATYTFNAAAMSYLKEASFNFTKEAPQQLYSLTFRARVDGYTQSQFDNYLDLAGYSHSPGQPSQTIRREVDEAGTDDIRGNAVLSAGNANPADDEIYIAVRFTLDTGQYDGGRFCYD